MHIAACASGLLETLTYFSIGGAMLQQENQTQSSNFEWVCQALSATGEPCDTSATCHCAVCRKWFCVVHAEDEAWHRCALEPGEEGGEG
jgi:hypothetical protein